MPRVDLIRYRRGLAVEWTTVNPLLALGEPGFEWDTHRLKIGDGELLYNALPYSDTAVLTAFLAGAPAGLNEWLELTAAITADQSGLAALTTTVAGHTSSLAGLSSTYVAKAKSAVNAKDYATGDGVTDDTAGLAAALVAARGKTLFIPDGTYLTSAELLYDTATYGPISIVGASANAIIKTTGATNKAIHITGTPGATRSFVTLDGFQVFAAGSGKCAAGIHLDGVADYQIHDVVIANRAKFTVGILLSGAQQGEISGGYIGADVGVKAELNGAVASNGADIHGVSFDCTVAGITLAGVDTAFIHGNHLTSSPVGIDVISGGYGIITITENHVGELATTASIRVAGGQAYIAGNSCFGAVGCKDLHITGGNSHTVVGNLFNRDVVLATPADSILFMGNTCLGAFTNTSTNITTVANTGGAGPGPKLGNDSLAFIAGNPSISSTGNFYFDVAAAGTINFRRYGSAASFTMDGSGNILTTRGVAQWGHAAVASKPAAPVTLADVIAILQAYGMCS